jgi:flavin reductase (DIM6/NTAB) family NADH-FMN oxidoreductase RutF
MEFSLTGDEAPDYRTIYKLLTGSVVPRPIGWVSTVNAEGRPNLAPYSFFNATNSKPPHVLFCPGTRATDYAQKDSLNNVRQTGEFVVNIVNEAVAEAMNITATELPADVNEFELAGLTPMPSVTVRPPRVAESPIHFECEVTHVIELGEPSERGAGNVVIGRVIHIHVSDEVLYDGDKINFEKLKPVGRLAGNYYTRVDSLFKLIRQPPQVPPAD